MAKLKQASKQEFDKFLKDYKGEIIPHQWNETCLFCDFNRPSEHAIGTGERVEDALIAKSYEPWYESCPELHSEYYILDE